MSTSTDTPPQTPPPPSPVSGARLDPERDIELIQLAVTTLDAALSSASTDVIGATQWWDRATAALRTAAAAGYTWPRVVSTLARKLQIDTYSEHSARALDQVGRQLTDPSVLARWCYLAERDAHYVVAMTRLQRAERHGNRKAGSQ